MSWLRVRETTAGTPQGGILSPLMANIALSILDEHFTAKWEELGPDWKRARHRRAGGASMKIIRYADLCRTRHKSAYAEHRIMPREGGSVVVAGLDGSLSSA